MAEYIKIPVEIQVEKGGDIHKRLSRIAKVSGSSVEDELAFLVALGINHHLRLNIKRLEVELGIAD